MGSAETMKMMRIRSAVVLFSCFACLLLLASCKGFGKEKASVTDVKADTKVGILEPTAQVPKAEEKAQAGAEQVESSKTQDLQRTITEETTTKETT